MNIVEEINKGEMERIYKERPIPEFAPGDALKVHVKVVLKAFVLQEKRIQ